MRKHLLTSLIIILTFQQVLSQEQNTVEQNYLQGKEMYEASRFDFAMEILEPLTLATNKSTYAPYAAYYYSLSAIEKGYTFLAEEMLKRIINQNDEWEYLDLARFWLAKVYFEENEYILGLDAINDIIDPGVRQKSDELIKSTFTDIEDIEFLIDLYFQFSTVEGLAVILADKISLLPLMEQDRALLFEIIDKFNLDKDAYHFIDEFESVKKTSYNVAVLLPFMLNDIIPSNLRRSNQFVLDIYDGINVGLERLRRKGVNINVFAYDTKRDAQVTMKLIESGELDGMDLLIGPLYPETFKLVTEFSLKKRINMFNPLSSNSDLIGINPFCFLFKPTTESMACAASNYIRNDYRNKNAMIFYEDDPRDSIMAFTYKEAIEKDSFNVVLLQKITGLDTITVYNTLTQKIRFADLDLTGEDSSKVIERYNLYDFFRKIERAQSIEDQKKLRSLEIFVIPPDSIGHIFVASNKELIAASTISGMETRGDTITVIGHEEWLDFKSLSLNQMESLDIKFISPGFISNTNPRFEDVYQKILYTLNKAPNKYHYLGFELINFIGEMLYQYGIYFQVGLQKQGIYPGILYQGFDYTRSNDNRLIPIVEFKDARFSIINQ